MTEIQLRRQRKQALFEARCDHKVGTPVVLANHMVGVIEDFNMTRVAVRAINGALYTARPECVFVLPKSTTRGVRKVAMRKMDYGDTSTQLASLMHHLFAGTNKKGKK